MRPGRSRRNGGCDFPVDPEIDAANAFVVWRPDWHIANVILDHAPPIFSNVRRFDPECLPWHERRASEDGDYFRVGMLPGIPTLHVLMLPRYVAGSGCALVLPIDDAFMARLEAARSFWSHYINAADPLTVEDSLGDHMRHRLISTLRALDGRAAGASHRIIGHVVLNAPLLRAIEWKDHSARSKLQRLFAEGEALVAGGYRRFLLPAAHRH
mgnify:CR=1 FL=1